MLQRQVLRLFLLLVLVVIVTSSCAKQRAPEGPTVADAGSVYTKGALCSESVVNDRNEVARRCTNVSNVEQATNCRFSCEWLVAKYPGLDCRAYKEDRSTEIRVIESDYLETIRRLKAAGA